MNIIGKQFGRLIVLEKFDDGKKYSYKYTCECQCENKTIKIFDKARLTNGSVLSCGCIQEEEKIKEAISHIGEKYGKLTITNLLGKREDIKSSGLFYECSCDCGSDKMVHVLLYDLKRGHQQSCGKCVVMSEETKRKISEARKHHNTFVEHDDYIEGFTEEGISFLFDKDDFEKIKAVGKYITVPHGYALFSDRENGDFQLHRFVMGLGKYDRSEDIIVDHINGNTLDNRKRFMRICHRSKNPKNATTYKNNTSGHKGVSWLDRLDKWQVSIQVDKKNIYLGVYSNFDEAVQVRKESEIKYFGEYSRDYRNDATPEVDYDL